MKKGRIVTDRIILVRHCETTGQGAQDDLTADGHRGAALLVVQLASIGADAVYSSPYLRAINTVSPFATSLNQPVHIIDDLRERVLSHRALPDWRDHLRQSFADRDYALPGGESMRQTEARGLAALGLISRAAHKLPVVASHGGLIASLLSGIDEGFGFDDWAALANPDLFILTLDDGLPKHWARG
jgi:2,3-bisphosphoglycerate-dependent phosphoglycerate mutase